MKSTSRPFCCIGYRAGKVDVAARKGRVRRDALRLYDEAMQQSAASLAAMASDAFLTFMTPPLGLTWIDPLIF
jgi:hypothetical protein